MTQCDLKTSYPAEVSQLTTVKKVHCSHWPACITICHTKGINDVYKEMTPIYEKFEIKGHKRWLEYLHHTLRQKRTCEDRSR